jgi:hypothetical protein
VVGIMSPLAAVLTQPHSLRHAKLVRMVIKDEWHLEQHHPTRCAKPYRRLGTPIVMHAFRSMLE